jgi:hypothetical protein
MSAYLLTYLETWTLCTLLHLPVQSGSVLSAWLSDGEFPESTDLGGESLASLAGKGYHSPEDKEQPLQPELLKSLALASVNAAEITAILRRNGQAALTRFAQMGKSVMQYGMDEAHLSLHPVVGQAMLVEKIIPDWFTVTQNEGMQAELPLGAFLLFKRACELTDLTAAETNFESEKFARSKLLEQSKLLDGWVDIFNAGGLDGVPALVQMPLEDDYKLLVSDGFLRESAADTIEIGTVGKALADSLSDPDMCSLIVSLQIWEGGFPKTGIFLYGGERLFFLDASRKPGNFVIRQLANRQEGCSWVMDLLVEGSHARYADYVIAPVK